MTRYQVKIMLNFGKFGIRGSIRRSLSDVAARSAVQAFIMSKVDYCNSALLGLSATMVDRVQHLMNAAARLILRLPKFSHISVQMGDDLHWLPVQKGYSSRSC